MPNVKYMLGLPEDYSDSDTDDDSDGDSKWVRMNDGQQ